MLHPLPFTLGFPNPFVDYYDIVINPVDYLIGEDDVAVILAQNEQQLECIFSDDHVLILGDKGAVKKQIGGQKVNLRCEDEEIKQAPPSQIPEQKVFDLSKESLVGKISNHYLIFGEIEYLEQVTKEIRATSSRLICYVSKVELHPPGLSPVSRCLKHLTPSYSVFRSTRRTTSGTRSCGGFRTCGT